MAARPLRILAISGSLRKASNNSGVVRYLASLATPAVEFTIADISGLPLYSLDLEGTGPNAGFPAAVAAFRRQVAEADAFIWSTPEHNYGPSAVIKNAIDWGSRTGPDYASQPWANKPVLIVGAAARMGSCRAQAALRLSAVFLRMHALPGPEVCINAYAGPAMFDAEGNLIDADSQRQAKAAFDAFLEYAPLFLKA